MSFLKPTILSLSIFLFTYHASRASENSFAESPERGDRVVRLSDGFYKTSTVDPCTERVLNKSDKNLVTTMSCNYTTYLDQNYERTGPAEYKKRSVVVANASNLRRCIPNKEDSTPCGAQNYDRRSGKLLLKVGDIETDTVTLTIYSETGYKIENVLTLERDGNTVSTALGSEATFVKVE